MSERDEQLEMKKKLRAAMAAKQAEAGAEKAADEPAEVTEDAEEKIPQKPLIIINVGSDRQWAEIELQRTGTDTADPSAADVYAALDELKISYGVKSELITQLCERPVYNRAIEIARGKQAQVGADGYLTYLIETKKDLRPKLRPDGTADYRDLGFIQNVEKGQVLCEVHPAEKGEDGCNILGEIIEGTYGKEQKAPTGKNTAYDEENRVVVASMAGNAEVVRGVINVYDVLKIRGNVDNSTGDINFYGDVIISGDIPSGFSVTSKTGNVVVQGTVEGAKITAKADIAVAGSINGMNRGEFKAGGSIKCKYIQNCKLITGADIYADSIMYCDVECSGNVELSGKRGMLIGGNAVIARALIAQTIGTDSHVATNVTMAGVGIGHNEKIKGLTGELKALDNELVTLIQTITWCEDLAKNGKLKPFHKSAAEQAKLKYPEVLERRTALNNELEEAKNELLNISPELCYIKCTGRVHTGVRITFGPQVMQVTSSFTNSRISLMGDIHVSPQ